MVFFSASLLLCFSLAEKEKEKRRCDLPYPSTELNTQTAVQRSKFSVQAHTYSHKCRYTHTHTHTPPIKSVETRKGKKNEKEEQRTYEKKKGAHYQFYSVLYVESRFELRLVFVLFPFTLPLASIDV